MPQLCQNGTSPWQVPSKEDLKGELDQWTYRKCSDITPGEEKNRDRHLREINATMIWLDTSVLIDFAKIQVGDGVPDLLCRWKS
jgi:hypothetical protein